MYGFHNFAVDGLTEFDETLDDDDADAEHDWLVLLIEGWLIKIFNVDVDADGDDNDGE